MKLVTAATMGALEAQAVAAGTSLDDLMESAGLAVAQEVWLTLGVVGGRRILVLVGPGNNGGDGLVAARHLAGWEADVAVYLAADRPAGDEKLALVRETSVPVFNASTDASFATLQDALNGAELVIDALLGTGRSRPIDGVLAQILTRLRDARERAAPPKVIAVDLPTGVDADSGNADPLAVHASTTITFGVAKVGLHTLPGSEHAGNVQVVDIGLPKEAVAALPLELLGTAWARERLPKRPKASNKGTFGRVLVIAGSPQYPGAARLAAEACYRAGAGLVTVACSPALRSTIAPALPEATYLPLPDGDESLTAAAAATLRDALDGYDAVVIGPGLGQREGVADGVMQVLANISDNIRGCVVDADALNGLAKTPDWYRNARGALVLTPHPGEMARLLNRTVAAVQADRLSCALEAARTWGQVVVLKGAHTVVAAPDGRAAVSPHANALLATAGTGDVLAGAVAGLITGGMTPFDAAACGVYIHGLAAEELGETLGDRGLLASDLLPALPRAIRTIREGRALRGGAFMPMGDLGGGGLDGLPGAFGAPTGI